jgi:hypothetical protein
MAVLFIVTALAAPIIPTAAPVVLMSPVAFNTADQKTRHFRIVIRIPINQATKPLFWLNLELCHEKLSCRLHMPALRRHIFPDYQDFPQGISYKPFWMIQTLNSSLLLHRTPLEFP